LGKVLLSADNRRAKRAINMIREFARHHMKIENVKIDEELSHQIWKRGIRRPPRKIRVRMTKTDEGFVLISLYEEEIETKEPEKTKPKHEKKAEREPKLEVKTKQVSEVVEEVKPKVETKVSEVVEEVKPKVETKVSEVVEEIKPKVETKVSEVVEEVKPKVETKVSEVVEEVKPKEKPKKAPAKEKSKIASFVDPKKDPQHYINRYNKEKKYKEWFDKNYPKLTIEEAVGLKPSKAKEEKSQEKPKKDSKKTQAKEEKPKKKSS